MRPTELLFLLLALLTAPGLPLLAQPVETIDLASLPTAGGQLHRLHGSTGSGAFGLPVAGGPDADGDGFVDYAMASFRADSDTGTVYLVFGDGTLGGALDTAIRQPRILEITGSHPQENAGSEIWMEDTTGDGLGELLICRQNFSPAGRTGAGALSIVVGGPELRARAEALQVLDLGAVPAGITVTTLIGATAGERLGMWVRTGDVTGDGVADLVVGADQRGASHNGAAYVVRGGAHLATGGEIDLAGFGGGGFPLSGNLARVDPPAVSSEYHFGATVQIADLDDNGRGEVLVAATLNRAGGVLQPPGGFAHGSGGAPAGMLFIAWDDAFADPWPAGFSFPVDGSPALGTTIQGGAANRNFAEELLGGLDFDADGDADLFVGDITGASPNGGSSGLGHVFYDAALLKGESFNLDVPPPTVSSSTIYGPGAGAIGADTATQGDFDGDGIGDLAFSAPHDAPLGRVNAGTLYVLFGRGGGWPEIIDLAPGQLPSPAAARIVEIQGANGAAPGGNRGDTLAYSAAAADLDGNGCLDPVVNEMVGDGVAPGAIDVGNLIVVSSRLFGCLFQDGFESGDTLRWSSTIP